MIKGRKYYLCALIIAIVVFPILFHMNETISINKSQALAIVANTIPALEWEAKENTGKYIRSKYYNITYFYSSTKYTTNEMNELIKRRLINKGWNVKYNVAIPHGGVDNEHYVFMCDNKSYDLRVELRPGKFTLIISFKNE